LLDKITPSLIINLYANYFTCNNKDVTFTYNGSLKNFIENLNERTIPSSLLDVLDKQKCKFYNGNIAVEVRNHCLNDQTELSSAEITRIWLHMTPEDLWMDLCLLNERFGQPLWPQDAALELESKILSSTEKDICLDPKIDVFKVKNLINYNDCKHNIKKKKRKDKTNEDEEAEKKAQQQQLLLLFSEHKQGKKETRSRFNRINFIEEWRKKKTMADSEPLVCINSNNKKPNKLPTSNNLLLNLNRVVRTLRFENITRGIKIYTVLNIYELPNGENEAVLRWGTVPNTSINGGLLKYPIGNNAAAEYYIAHFIYFYSLTNKLVFFSDDIDKDKEKSYTVVYQPDLTNKDGIQCIPISISSLQHKNSVNSNSPQTMYSNLSSVSNSNSYQYSPHVAKKAKIQSSTKISSSKSGQTTTATTLPNTTNNVSFSPVSNPTQTTLNTNSLQQKLQQSQLQQQPQLPQSQLSQPQLSQPQLSQPQLSQPQLSQPQLPQSQLQKSQLQQSQLQQSQLQQSQLQQSQLQQSQLQQSQISQSQLSQSQLPQSQLTQSQLQKAQLQTQLHKAQLQAQLQQPQLQQAQLQQIQLQQTQLQQAKLQQAQLQQIQLQQSQLQQAQLQKAQLQNPHLQRFQQLQFQQQIKAAQAQAVQAAQTQLQLQNQGTPPLKATPTLQSKSLSNAAVNNAAVQVKANNITPSIPTKSLTATTATIPPSQISKQSPVSKVNQKIPTAAVAAAKKIPVTQGTPIMKTPSQPPQPMPQQTTPLLSSQTHIKTTPNIPFKSSPPLNVVRQPNAAAAMNKYYPEGVKMMSSSPPAAMLNNQLKMTNLGFIQHQNPSLQASLLAQQQQQQQQLLLQHQLALQQQNAAAAAAGVPVHLLQGARAIPPGYTEATIEQAYSLQAQKNALEQARRQQYAAAAAGIPYQAMAFPTQLNKTNLINARPNVQQLYQQLQSRQAALQQQYDIKNKKK